MVRYIAFLRAINIGGHTVKMDRLKTIFESLDLDHVETFIASGNVIFETDENERDELTRRIESGLQQALGYEVVTFLRSDVEVLGISRYQPFAGSQLQQVEAFNVALLKEPLDEEGWQKLFSLETEIDHFCAHGHEFYWLCHKKQSESSFSAALFERKLKVRTTFRNMNTLLRLADKYSPRAQ
jgi:uncharacterized protein (DUF1697 family)